MDERGAFGFSGVVCLPFALIRRDAAILAGLLLLLRLAIADGVGTRLADRAVQAAGGGPLAALPASTLVSAAFSVLASVDAAAVYLELRRERGCAPPQDIVEAFT